jgi:hypothetical protein
MERLSGPIPEGGHGAGVQASGPVCWARWWLWLWGGVGVTLLVLAFFPPLWMVGPRDGGGVRHTGGDRAVATP